MIDPATGQPVTRIEDGVPVIVRGAALVETMSGNAGGLARKSRLTEILFGETLMAGAEARTTHPNPPAGAPNHATMLNAAEKRLIDRVDGPGRPVLQRPVRAAPAACAR